MEEIKQQIINLLKKDELSSTNIGMQLNEGYWKIVNILKEMEEEGLIRKINSGKYQTYWELKK